MLKTLAHLPKFSLIHLEPKNLDAKQKVTVSYRYISWLMTSFFYLVKPPNNNTLWYKLALVVALFFFSRLIMDYYLKEASFKAIQTKVLLETIALILLLIPTGGLESPFSLYALNPVLIASNYLKLTYCWLDLLFYFAASLFITFKLFNPQNLMIPELLQDKSYILLVYILVTIAMGLLAQLIKHLDQQAEELQRQRQELMTMNDQLQEANASVKHSMEYVMSLYHIVETFSSREDTLSVLNRMVDSAAKLTESQGAFLWLSPYKDNPSSLLANISSPQIQKDLSTYFDQKETVLMTREESFTFKIEDNPLLAIRVQSSSRFYGYIGIELSTRKNECLGFKRGELLAFIGELVSFILERYDTEKLASKLMIIEEQDRIGNEIHDKVSQRLFSILCAIHALKINWQTLNSGMISKQLELIEQSIKATSKELRASIYHLSSIKKGVAIFKDNLQNYLRDFASLNHVNVNFDFQGDEERIPTCLKQAIHRIVREASGNAVRHGQCTQLDVSLSIYASALELLIKDNGKGFNKEIVLSDRGNRGLGLNNIYVLTQTFNGRVEFLSEENKGTKFLFKFPLGCVPEQLIVKKGGAA